jgi:DNA-binding SARP family transcriptional activator
MRGLSIELPTGYYLERDPDILILRRLDGSMVGAFSTRGAAPEAVREAAEEASPQLSPSHGSGAPDSVPERSTLRANFFGHFEVLCDEEPLPLGRNGKALTILKYLIANRSRPVSQDHLMGWLWPESNLKKARWSLNSAIHGLRKLLGSCPSSLTSTTTTTPAHPSSSSTTTTTTSTSSSEQQPQSHVLLEEGYYRLCPQVRVSTDVEEFEGLYEEGVGLEKEGRIAEALERFEGAIALYRGDYLLEDLYEDWTMVERERLVNAYVDMLGRMAEHALFGGRHQESIRACYRVLEKDRCHEESHRRLMRCYAALGLRARALRQYRLCEEALAQEYGLSPSPDTLALHASLLNDRYAS